MDLSVKVNGSKLALGEDVLFINATLDMRVNQAAMFTMVVIDKAEPGLLMGPSYKHLDDSTFKIGAKVEVSAREYDDMMYKSLASGLEIVSIEPSFGVGNTTSFLIRAYDKTQRLRRGSTTRVFSKMTDAAIIKKICGDYGISTAIKGLTTKHEYVIQNNQSDWEFIMSRVQMFGCACQVDNKGKLVVGPVEKKSSGKSVTLEYPDECIRFTPRVTVARQVAEVEVLAYDSSTAQPVKSKAKVKAVLNGGGMALASEAKKGVQAKSRLLITADPSVKTAVAKLYADGAANQVGMESVDATGVCLGKTDLVAGGTVKIEGVGKRFSGKYILSGVTHRFQSNGSFTTEFSVSNTPHFGQLLYEKIVDQNNNQVEGVVVGIVTNIEDPEKMGRVKLKFPWLGEDIESDWARVATPMASTKAGIFFPLAINDEVLVCFERGDANRPFVVGSLFTKKIKHPNDKAVEKDKVNFLTFKGRSGHYIEFTETKGKEAISIIGLKDKSYLKFDTNKGNLDIKMMEDIKIACKNLTIESKGKINVKAMQDIGLKTNTKFTLIAQQKAIIKGGMSIELATNSGKSVKIGPATVNINAGALEVM